MFIVFQRKKYVRAGHDADIRTPLMAAEGQAALGRVNWPALRYCHR